MEFIRKHYKLILFCIPIISLALHFHVFSLDLVGYHVWRQTETQTVINNFYTEDLNILNPRINDHADTARLHRIEFPLMQWIFALFYKIFGPHIALSRILTFLVGLGSVYGMFYLCRAIFKNNVIATICAWCFNFSPIFYYYTVNPMPDNMALCFAIWSIGLFYTHINSGKIRYMVWSALLLGLAVLVKLPFVLYGSFMLAYIIVQLRQKKSSAKQLLLYCIAYLLCIIPAVVWYASVIPTWNNNPVVKGILDMQISGKELSHVFFGAIYSTLPELLINYGAVLFFIAGFWFMFKNKKHTNRYFPLFVVWGVSIMLYFLFEMNAITLVHDYYLFPFLPQIFLLVAYGAYSLLQMNRKSLTVITMLCLAVLPLTAFLRADTRWDTKEPLFNPVYFSHKEQLRNLTPRNAYCIVGNDDSHYILLYYIDRKGWAFDHDQLDEKQLSYYISKGAQYLFSDSRIDEKPEIKNHLGEKIFEKESVRVYRLK